MAAIACARSCAHLQQDWRARIVAASAHGATRCGCVARNRACHAQPCVSRARTRLRALPVQERGVHAHDKAPPRPSSRKTPSGTPQPPADNVKEPRRSTIATDNELLLVLWGTLLSLGGFWLGELSQWTLHRSSHHARNSAESCESARLCTLEYAPRGLCANWRDNSTLA